VGCPQLVWNNLRAPHGGSTHGLKWAGAGHPQVFRRVLKTANLLQCIGKEGVPPDNCPTLPIADTDTTQVRRKSWQPDLRKLGSNQIMVQGEVALERPIAGGIRRQRTRAAFERAIPYTYIETYSFTNVLQTRQANRIWFPPQPEALFPSSRRPHSTPEEPN